MRRAKYLYVCKVQGCEKVYSSSGKAVIHEKATGHRSFAIVEEIV